MRRAASSKIIHTTYVSLTQIHHLRPTGVDETASGRYQCSATSRSGQLHRAEVRLRVTSRPGQMTSLVTLTSAEAVNSSAVRLALQVQYRHCGE